MYKPVPAHSPRPNPQLAARPWVAYSWALLPFLFIIVPSLIFDTLLRLRGSLPAPTAIANFVSSEPRRSAQIVALIGSILASAVKLGLTKAFTLTARKRFTKFRSLFELEDWISFTNGWMVFPMHEPLKRWRAILASVTLMLVRGLLTSSFVSLIAPVPVQTTKQIAGDFQVDMSSNIPACLEWNNQRRLANRCDGTVLRYKSFSYQNCEPQTHMFDTLEAGKASMLSHVSTALSASYPKDFVSTYPRLEHTRILGSPAGVVPMGPGGIEAFSTMLSLSDIATTANTTNDPANSNYKLTLQGVWADVSCKYVDQMENFPWPPVLKSDNSNSSQPQYSTQLKCPDASGALVDVREVDVSSAEGLILAHECASNNTNTWDFYLRSASRLRLGSTPSTTTAPYSGIYGGIGSMSCTIKPQLRNINAAYNASLKAFSMSPNDDDPIKWSQPTDLFTLISTAVLRVFNEGDLFNSGNLVASLIDSIAESRYNLPLEVKDDRYPALIASMIKGMFEYEASHLRLISTMSVESAPGECRNSVLGTVNSHLIGWSSKGSTSVLALIPVGLVALMILLFTSWAVFSGGILTVFDPTSPVSVIASASAGGLHFDSDELADLHGNQIRRTRIKYGRFVEAGAERWGLVQRQMT